MCAAKVSDLKIKQLLVVNENDQIQKTQGNRNASQSQVAEVKKVTINNQKGLEDQRSRMQKVTGHFSEFMNNSTIHGFRYLVGNERPLIEKCFWLIVVSVSIYLCSTQIASLYKKWEENPVFIGVSQDPVQLWEIPLPAITVCPLFQINKNSSYTFNVTLTNLRDRSNTTETWDATWLCREHPFQIIPNIKGQDLPDIIIKTGFTKDQIFNSCQFSEKLISSCEYFSPILTDQGLCFTANMLDRRDIYHNVTYIPNGLAEQKPLWGWDLDERNLKINKTHSYPMTAVNTTSLFLENLKKVGCAGSEKYNLYLHHPKDTPALRSPSIILNSYTRYQIKIKPKVTVSSDTLRSYSPRKRKCFFTFESELHFYKTYSFLNCKMECLANYTLKHCGCVLFFMPHYATTSVCLDNSCPNQAREKLQQSELEISDDPFFKSCNCLPSCSSVTYITNFEAEKWPWPRTSFSMMVSEEEILSFERNELFGDISFLASCGGLLGLFTGFSFMSLIEIIYFFSFRWVCRLAKSYCRRRT